LGQPTRLFLFGSEVRQSDALRGAGASSTSTAAVDVQIRVGGSHLDGRAMFAVNATSDDERVEIFLSSGDVRRLAASLLHQFSLSLV